MTSSISAIIKAANFAAVKHKDQRRKDPMKTPYINHPIGVAQILTSEGLVDDPLVLQAALLHDTVEDTKTTFDELEENFGQRVRDIVAEVTDDKSLPKLERRRLQVVHAKGEKIVELDTFGDKNSQNLIYHFLQKNQLKVEITILGAGLMRLTAARMV